MKVSIKEIGFNKTDLEIEKQVIEEIKMAYSNDERPWIIGYSGGKDSTATLQLVWYALSGLIERKKLVYVITSDTLVETPIIARYLEKNIQNINDVAKKQGLPITAQKLIPELNNRFWVNLIGRGYPAPQQTFRWCTDRLKIATSTKFIKEKISKYGEAVVVLGTRKNESDSRARVMAEKEIKDNIFSRNSQFSAAFTYAPIRNWSTWDVWKYLIRVPSPWGNDNEELARMYKNATGECPFVVDDKTPPCGNSRFGCWVCTLVERDKSMESLVQSSESWLKPLLNYRDFLVTTQDPSSKNLYREFKRRQGFVSFKSNGSGEISRGPYTLDFRKELLSRLLKTQKEIQMNDPGQNIYLISIDELKKIRRIWRTEEGDWEDSIVKIYETIIGREIIWEKDDINPFGKSDKNELVNICEKNGIPSNLITKLIDIEIKEQGMTRRSSIFSEIDKIFHEEWRSEDEVKKEYAERKMR
jgi:DNA sulfur modification protein DndC